jgi:hypothetical protein
MFFVLLSIALAIHSLLLHPLFLPATYPTALLAPSSLFFIVFKEYLSPLGIQFVTLTHSL